MRGYVRACAIVALLAAAPYAHAEQPSAPPAAGENEDDPSKFFWFNKSDTPVDVARTDISYCLAQVSSVRAMQRPDSYSGGLIGALVSGIINGITEGVESRRMRDAGMRKCMGLYGYARFHVPEPQWNEMMRASDALDRLAVYATGPVPVTERLDP